MDTFGNLCPITMNYHQVGAVTCDRCETAVRRHLEWFERQTPERQARVTSGAWFANDSLHWAALELRADRMVAQ